MLRQTTNRTHDGDPACKSPDAAQSPHHRWSRCGGRYRLECGEAQTEPTRCCRPGQAGHSLGPTHAGRQPGSTFRACRKRRRKRNRSAVVCQGRRQDHERAATRSIEQLRRVAVGSCASRIEVAINRGTPAFFAGQPDTRGKAVRGRSHLGGGAGQNHRQHP